MTVLGMPEALFWTLAGVVLAAVGIGLSVYLYRRSKSQGRMTETRLDVLQRDVEGLRHDLRAYLDGLPAAAAPVRDRFLLGEAARRAYRWDEAIRHYRAAMKEARGTELAALFNLVGLCHYLAERRQQALENYEESARLAGQLDDQRGRGIALHNAGVVRHDWGELDEARRLFEESLALTRRLGDDSGVAKALHHLGLIHQVKGEIPRARSLYEESLVLARRHSSAPAVAQTLHNLATVHQVQGNFGRARELYEESLKLAREHGDKHGIARGLHQLAMLSQEQGNVAAARELYEESLALKRELGSRTGIATTLGQLGMLAEVENDYRAALVNYSVALAVFEQLKSHHAGTARECLDDLRARLGDEAFAQLARDARPEIDQQVAAILGSR
ncbi:MAG: tetratricopeptide repeat protein [bacterium]